MSQAHLQNLDILPKIIQQPGPAGEPWISVPTRLEKLDFELTAGIALDDALSEEIKTRGLSGAYIRIVDASMERMQYVIPGLAPNDEHVAWFSETISPAMPGRIEDASIICGVMSGKPTFHCHGQISDANQNPALGHLLLESCYLSSPVRVTGLGFKDARFNRKADPQTNFDLLMPEAVGEGSNFNEGLLVRVAPNIEIAEALIECCRRANWQRASIHGVGSLIGAHFDDGRVLKSFATEYMVTSGAIELGGSEPHIDLQIALVGLGGDVMQGRLAQVNNPVLITSEILLQNQSKA